MVSLQVEPVAPPTPEAPMHQQPCMYIYQDVNGTYAAAVAFVEGRQDLQQQTLITKTAQSG